MRSSLFVLALAAAGWFAAPVYSQDQETERRPDAPPSRGGIAALAGSLLGALDANRDGEISADEIAGAADALKTLDRDKNGKLTSDELQRRPSGRRGVADDGSRPQGFGQRRGPEGGFGGARGFGGGFGGGPQGVRTPRGDQDRGDQDRRGPPRADQDRGQPRRDIAERGGPDRGRRGPGFGGFGPINPEQFVARAMEFDADRDGELNKAELTALAERISGGIRGGFDSRGGFGSRGGGFGDRSEQPRNPARRGGDRPDRPEPDRDD